MMLRKKKNNRNQCCTMNMGTIQLRIHRELVWYDDDISNITEGQRFHGFVCMSQ